MLNRVKNLFKRLKEKVKHLNRVIKYVKKQNDKCYIVILFDIIWCYVVYFMDLEEYKKYEFYNIKHNLRKTYLNDVYHDLMRPFIYKKDYEDIFKNTFIIGFPEQYNAIIGSCPFVENPINSTNVFESFILFSMAFA